MKKIFIVHRWGGSPKEPMLAWLATELKKKNYEVHSLEMPHPEEPTIDDWTAKLNEEVKNLDKDTYFIGHSIGCQTILRYLEKQKHVCGGAVLIAGWFTLQGLETKEEEKIAEPWLETPIDFDKILRNLPKLIAIFSDNDQFVPLDNKDIFKEKLNAEIHVEHNKGHFTESDGVTSSALIVKSLLKMSEI